MPVVIGAGLVIDGIYLPVEWTIISIIPINCKKEDTYTCVFYPSLPQPAGSAVMTTGEETYE
jgi:hypothetical protein